MIKLLPYKLKIYGWISVFAATTLTFLYFYYGIKISMPVFAVYSSYLETKLFAFFITNFTEELILLLYIAGFSLIVFSKEKNESGFLKLVRIKALTNMIKTVVIWWLFTVLFIFGNGFMVVLILNLVLPFIIYIFFFYRIKNSERKKSRLEYLQRKLQ